MIKLFYYDFFLDDGIESENAIEVTFEKTLEKFYNLSEDERSFLGIKTNENTTIQFQWLKENMWLIDIPQIPKRGSLQKKCEYDECVNIIKSIFEDKFSNIPQNFSFFKW